MCSVVTLVGLEGMMSYVECVMLCLHGRLVNPIKFSGMCIGQLQIMLYWLYLPVCV